MLCRTAFDAIAFLDDERTYVCLTDRAAGLLGAPADEIVGRRADDFTPPDRTGRIDSFWATIMRGGTIEGRGPLVRVDGSRGMVEYRARGQFGPSLHLFAMREVDAPAAAENHNIPRLTPREREVIQLAAEGRSTREIAGDLVLSPGTVKTHFQHIYEKLGAHDRVAAVATALRLGLIS